MEKILLFGDNKPVDKEFEFVYDDNLMPFGFDCHIQFKDYLMICRNCTEIHHMYDQKRAKELSTTPHTAFESDIHNTGGIRLISDIISIKVIKSDKKYQNHREHY